MNEVPRETATAKKSTVRPLLLRADLRLASRQKVKLATRRIVAASNSEVRPGRFEGLDLDTGRARRKDPPELRAQCTFESGNVRVVTVTSKVVRGDLFWVKAGRFSPRKASELTFDITGVDVSRLQDMTDEDAIEEGVELVPVPKRRVPSIVLTSPREKFAWLWNRMYGGGKDSWEANPWVWTYRYLPFAENVDALLARRAGAE